MDAVSFGTFPVRLDHRSVACPILPQTQRSTLTHTNRIHTALLSLPFPLLPYLTMAAAVPNAGGGPPAPPAPPVVPAQPAPPAMPALNADYAYALTTVDPLDPEVQHIFTICGCTSPVLVRALRIEGINTLDQFSVLQPSDIKDLAGRIRAAPASCGGAAIGAVHITNLSAVSTWLYDRKSRSLATVPTVDLDAAALDEARDMHRMAKTVKDEDSVVEKPKKFKPLQWITWEASVMNYLSSLKGSNGSPLAYVIRKDLPAGTAAPVGLTTLYQIPLTGAVFKHDNRRVHQILVGYLADTEGYSWIKPVLKHQSGRRTMAALRDHYDGPQASARRVAIATSIIDGLHYKSKNAMPFETFTSKLTDAFQTLAENGEERTDHHKVTTLLKKINSNNPEFLATVGLVRTMETYNTDYYKAIQKLSTAIAAIYPTTSARQSGRRVSNVRRHGNNNRRGNNNNANYDRTKYPHGIKYKGVDISDPTRFFHGPEWTKLSPEIKHWVHNHPDRIRNNAEREARRNTSALQVLQQLQEQLQQQRNTPPTTVAAATSSNTSTTASTNSTSNNSGGVSFGRGSYSRNE